MVIMTPEAKLIPASLLHQIQVRIAVMTMMTATAINSKIRGAAPARRGGAYASFALEVGVIAELMLTWKWLSATSAPVFRNAEYNAEWLR